MKASMKDLNDLLFEQLERLNDDELTGNALDEQLKKSKMISTISMTIARNVDLTLKAAKLEEQEGKLPEAPRMMLGLEAQHV